MRFIATRWAAAVAALLAVSACATAPPPPDPTVAQITFAAAEDANPDPTGRASPAVVFVYALQPGAPFATAPADQMLGGPVTEETIRRIARIVIVPGREQKKLFTLPDGTSDVGIAVAYRQIETAKWREQAPVTANAVTLIKAGIGANEVTVQ